MLETALPQELGQWLGGLFEIGSTAGFRIRKELARKGSVKFYSLPYIKFQEQDEDKITRFKNLFELDGKNSHISTIIWAKAAELIALMAGFAPSRRDLIDAVLLWQVSDVQTRLAIAEEFGSSKRFFNGNYIQAQHYRHLVNLPSFVAGNLDGRAFFGTQFVCATDYDRAYPLIEIQSINRPLLEALHCRFDGNLSLPVPAGTTVSINGICCVTKRESVKLSLVGNDARRIVQFAEPYILLSKPQAQLLLAA